MITLKLVKHSAEILGSRIIRTPLVFSPTLSRIFNGNIYLKLENLQKTGSFKIRGALYKLLKDKKNIGQGGVITASAGNHAQGVALAANHAGVEATIIMPEWASISKQEATRNYGGKVLLKGQSIKESLDEAGQLAQEDKTFIHPFDDKDIITGQGTISLEILEDLNAADIIIVPIGGGGLISGIASVAKKIRPRTKIIGVQAAGCPSAYESLKQGEIVQVASRPSIADGITVKQPGELNFEVIQQYVDDIVLVDEEHIASAILMLLERKKILAEGAGAVSLAALLNGSVCVPKGANVVLIISGGNVDSPLLGRILSQGLIKNGRIMRLWIQLEDTPGSMAKLLHLIARLEANVLHINHTRNVKHMPIYTTRVWLELETRGQSHIDSIIIELQKAEYDIEVR